MEIIKTNKVRFRYRVSGNDPAAFGLGQYRESLLPEPDYLARLSAHERTYYMTQVVKTEAEMDQLASCDQKGVMWGLARNRMTMSNSSNAAGHNPYDSSSLPVAAYNMIHKKFKGNANTQRGDRLEPVARDIFEAQELPIVQAKIQKAIEEQRECFSYGGCEHAIPKELLTRLTHVSGFHICREKPWLGCSSDGDILGKILLEIKAPNELYPLMPIYQFDQVQSNMYIRKFDTAFYVVIQEIPKKGIRVMCEFFRYDQLYCESFLIPALTRFYFLYYFPEAFKQWVNQIQLTRKYLMESQEEPVEKKQRTS